MFFGIFDFFKYFRSFEIVVNAFYYYWCVLYYKLLFLMRISDSVSFSVYMNIFWWCVSTCLEKCPEVWTHFVRTVFGECFCDFCLICCPPHPHPWRQSKFPTRGKIEKTCVCLFLKNRKMTLKLSRRWSIPRVGT